MVLSRMEIMLAFIAKEMKQANYDTTQPSVASATELTGLSCFPHGDPAERRTDRPWDGQFLT